MRYNKVLTRLDRLVPFWSNNPVESQYVWAFDKTISVRRAGNVKRELQKSGVFRAPHAV